jgi:hypothetical protein
VTELQKLYAGLRETGSRHDEAVRALASGLDVDEDKVVRLLRTAARLDPTPYLDELAFCGTNNDPGGRIR